MEKYSLKRMCDLLEYALPIYSNLRVPLEGNFEEMKTLRDTGGSLK